MLLVGLAVMMNPTVIPAQADSAPAKSSGILPLPDYSGELFKRSYILGDFGGKRTEWAKKGFTFDIDYNQYFQAVVDGGLDTGSQYGGTIDYNINIDFDRMGLIPGGLLQMRAVSRYGRSVNGISGAVIPVNTDATHPTTSTLDEDVGLWLPMITYTQFLSEKFAVSAGKFDTYDTANEFAGGRGRSQWWNLNFTMPVSPALIIPYSTLGAAVLVMPSPDLTITGMVGTITDTSNRSGFDNLDDGMFGLISLTKQYQNGQLPGGFGLMSGYGWDGDFNEINGRINFNAGQLHRPRRIPRGLFRLMPGSTCGSKVAPLQQSTSITGDRICKVWACFPEFNLPTKTPIPLVFSSASVLTPRASFPTVTTMRWVSLSTTTKFRTCASATSSASTTRPRFGSCSTTSN